MEKTLNSFESIEKEAPVYLVCVAHDADRKVILERIAERLKGQQKRFDTASLKEHILPLTRELSLFGGRTIYLSYQTEIEEEALVSYLASPSQAAILLLGVKESKGLGAAAKKGALCLDLSQEKPWEREKRIVSALRECAAKAKKNISPDLLLKLIARVGSDWNLLEQELDKLISFTGSRPEILLADLEGVGSESKTQGVWQISEEIIWGKGFPNLPLMETSEALALLGALRYQIQLGWQLCASPLDAPPLHIKPYQVQKYGKLSHAKTSPYFESALLRLIEVEKLLKTTSLDPRLLLSTFAANLVDSV